MGKSLNLSGLESSDLLKKKKKELSKISQLQIQGLKIFITKKTGDLLTISGNFLSFFFMNFRFVPSSGSNLNFQYTEMFIM